MTFPAIISEIGSIDDGAMRCKCARECAENDTIGGGQTETHLDVYIYIYIYMEFGDVRQRSAAKSSTWDTHRRVVMSTITWCVEVINVAED